MLSAMYSSIHKSCLRVSGADVAELMTYFCCEDPWPRTVNLALHTQPDDAFCLAIFMLVRFLPSFILQELSPSRRLCISPENHLELQLLSHIIEAKYLV